MNNHANTHRRRCCVTGPDDHRTWPGELRVDRGNRRRSGGCFCDNSSVTSGNSEPGVHFLLSLIEPQDVAAVRKRLGMAPPQVYADDRAMRELDRRRAPRSVLLWMLECDDPATNRLIFHHDGVPDAIKRDIMQGVPYGTATGPLQVLARCGRPACSHEAPQIPVSEHGMVAGLREARKIGAARTAVRAVSRDNWATIAEADRAEPLPGYARWALAERIDCPPQLRVQFGSHPKFTHRLRMSGMSSWGSTSNWAGHRSGCWTCCTSVPRCSRTGQPRPPRW